MSPEEIGLYCGISATIEIIETMLANRNLDSIASRPAVEILLQAMVNSRAQVFGEEEL